MLAARTEHARAEQRAGSNPLGLIFPFPQGKYWRSSNFNRNVLKRAYHAARWRDTHRNGHWTWHSLRHVFCTTALFTWKLDATAVVATRHEIAARGYVAALADGDLGAMLPASARHTRAEPWARELTCRGPGRRYGRPLGPGPSVRGRASRGRGSHRRGSRPGPRRRCRPGRLRCSLGGRGSTGTPRGDPAAGRAAAGWPRPRMRSPVPWPR
jgi:hypothetical protein